MTWKREAQLLIETAKEAKEVTERLQITDIIMTFLKKYFFTLSILIFSVCA